MNKYSRDYTAKTNFDLEVIFPGLRSMILPERMHRIEKIVERFFTITLKATSTGAPFVITGDISAMWLRDSTWQVAPFLKSPNLEIGEILADISISQQEFFLKDPYANAFNPEPNGACWHKDFPDQSPWVFERKYELDSLASILFLARRIKEQWDIDRHLKADYLEVVSVMLNLAKKEQNHDPNSYVFYRNGSVEHDSLANHGVGNKVGYTGMIYSAFRPSDDACKYGYLIPANLFFLNELKYLDLNPQISALIADISHGIAEFGIVDGVIAYEVDGLGNYNLMDDANVPSLLSLPYLGAIDKEDAQYISTKDFILSESNPYFFKGTKASGIGSQHTPAEYIWPISIAMKGLTTSENSIQEEQLLVMESTDGGTNFMHESFHKDTPNEFTRNWFSWADAMYLELVLERYNY
jgi:hypothetical protein